MMIARGADVNHVDKLGMTPLLWAAAIDFGDSEMIALLLGSACAHRCSQQGRAHPRRTRPRPWQRRTGAGRSRTAANVHVHTDAGTGRQPAACRRAQVRGRGRFRGKRPFLDSVSFQSTSTFDNGPMAATPIVLDLLAQDQVKADFVCGRRRRAGAPRGRGAGARRGALDWQSHSSHGPSFGDLDDRMWQIQEDPNTEVADPRSRDRQRRSRSTNSGSLDQRVLNRVALDHPAGWRLQHGALQLLPQGLGRPAVGEHCAPSTATNGRGAGVMVLHDNFDRALPGLERFPPAVPKGRLPGLSPECVPIRKGATTACSSPPEGCMTNRREFLRWRLDSPPSRGSSPRAARPPCSLSPVKALPRHRTGLPPTLNKWRAVRASS